MLTTGEANAASPPDIVYRVRRDERNEELRYSLRSLVNLAHGAVWFAGHLPAWVAGVRHIPTPKQANRWRNALTAIRAACAQTPEFVLMDDDFFLTEPLTEVPANHAGTLAERIATARGEYKASLQATEAFLARHGRSTRSYELHQPMLIDSGRMLIVLDLASAEPTPLQARSLYGNWWALPSTPAADCKVRTRSEPIPAGPFLSTEDGAFKAVLPFLSGLFPAPSRYEVA